MKKKILFSGISLLLTISSLLAQSSWKEIGNKENAPDIALEADYAITPKDEFIVIYDDRSSYGELRAKVKKYNGTKWIDLGADAISEGRAIDVRIAELNGTVYASYKEMSGGNTHVVRYDGKAWKQVGETVNDATDSRLIASKDKLYRAYYSGSKKRIAVFVLEGDTWKEVGTGGLLEEDSRYPYDLAISGSNELYIGYTNPSDINQAKVKKLVGDTWIDAGPQATTYTVKGILLAFEGDTPYIAVYHDRYNRIYVKKLVNSEGKYVWQAVGSDDGLAITDFADQLGFAITGGIPHLVYQQSDIDKMRGMTFVNNTWTTTGYLANDTDAGDAAKMLSASGKVYALFKDPNRNGLAIMQFTGGK